MEVQKGLLQTVLPEYLSVERYIYACYYQVDIYP